MNVPQKSWMVYRRREHTKVLIFVLFSTTYYNKNSSGRKHLILLLIQIWFIAFGTVAVNWPPFCQMMVLQAAETLSGTPPQEDGLWESRRMRIRVRGRLWGGVWPEHVSRGSRWGREECASSCGRTGSLWRGLPLLLSVTFWQRPVRLPRTGGGGRSLVSKSETWWVNVLCSSSQLGAFMRQEDGSTRDPT